MCSSTKKPTGRLYGTRSKGTGSTSVGNALPQRVRRVNATFLQDSVFSSVHRNNKMPGITFFVCPPYLHFFLSLVGGVDQIFSNFFFNLRPVNAYFSRVETRSIIISNMRNRVAYTKVGFFFVYR